MGFKWSRARKNLKKYAGTAIGGLVGGLPGMLLEQAFSAKSAGRQEQYQAAMSNTAHQREVADLRAAGLNPILSGTGGRGASTPSGTQMPTPNYSANALLAAQTSKLNAETLLTKSKTRAMGGVVTIGETLGEFLNFMKQQVISTGRDLKEAIKYYTEHFDGSHPLTFNIPDTVTGKTLYDMTIRAGKEITKKGLKKKKSKDFDPKKGWQPVKPYKLYP